MQNIKLLIIDKYPIAAQGLAALLNNQKIFTIAGFCSSLIDASRKVARYLPNIILMDVWNDDGIQFIQKIKTTYPDTKIVILSDSDEESKEAAILALYETKDTKAVLDHIDSFVNDILNKTDSTHYIGFLGNRNGSNTFRHKLAVTKPYKGQRAKTPHWVKYWKPIIVEHLVSVWKFIELTEIEADDGCSICANHFRKNSIDYIVCSPDKDLKQIVGIS